MIRRAHRLFRDCAAALRARILSAAAIVWRRLMFRTTFIAITGSAGKGTATACLGSILSAHFPTNWMPGGRNGLNSRIILNTRFRHRFTVMEVASGAPGDLRREAWTIAPDIVVILRVLHVHSNLFPTIEDVAREKAQLLSRLGKRGMAILNADDPRVLAMADTCSARIRTFGTSSGNFAVADQVSADWPQRLSFRVTCGSESALVQTSLPGEHLLTSALAALTTAVCCGVPLQQAALSIQNVQPVAGRMYPMYLPNGACIIRDDFTANNQKFMASLNFLARARASRRIVVVGDILDTGLTVRPRARDLGRRVAQAADMALFLGEEGRLSARSAVEAGMNPSSVFAYRDLREAADFLKSNLTAGDLVLSCGWQGRHTERVSLAQAGDIACWIERCSKVAPCEMCSELKLVSFPPRVSAAAGPLRSAPGQ